MGWFRRGPKEPDAPLDRAVEAFSQSIAALTPGQIAEARRRADASGIGSSHESAFAIGILVAAARHVGGRRTLNRASNIALAGLLRQPEVSRQDRTLGYVTQVVAEAITVRERIDPETWMFLTGPWRGLAELPEHWMGREPATVTKAREVRLAMASKDREPGRPR